MGGPAGDDMDLVRTQQAFVSTNRRSSCTRVKERDRVSMARVGAGVAEGSACYGDELPLVGIGAEVELENTRRA